MMLAVGIWILGPLLGVYVLSVVLLVPWVLLKKTVHPTAVVAWIITIVLLPYLGAALCLLLGANRVRRRERGRQQAAREFRGGRDAERDISPETRKLTERWRSVATLIERVGGYAPVPGNFVHAVEDTRDAFAMLESTLREAERCVEVQFYIFRSDDVGQGIRDLLIDAAKRGVTVRFQYDGFGSIGLTRRFLRPMREAGVKVATFLPGQTWRERWSVNLRNHRKIVIVDRWTAFTGGLNVGDEYLGRKRSWGDWTDAFVKVRGPAAGQLREVFAEDWYYATGERLEVDRPGDAGDCDSDGDGQLAQVIASGPADRIEALPMLFTAALAAGRERVTLATGYFVPPDPLLVALQAAALRGVRVRVLTAGASTLFLTRQAGRSYYQNLLDAGVSIHEYQAGLYHSKLLAVDDDFACIGSPNYDFRSMSLNFEVGLCIYGQRLACWVHEQVQRDLEQAKQIEPDAWSDRGLYRVLLERSARLLAPVL